MQNDHSLNPNLDEPLPYERIEPGRILVVDDNDEDRLKCIDALKNTGGHIVRDTAFPNNALKIAQDWSPEVILIDILMPEINGLELAKMLRKAGCDAQLMFVSTLDSTNNKIRGLRLGEQYLSKPFNPDLLCELVDSLLRNRRRLQATPSERSEALDLRPIFSPNARTVIIPPNREVKLTPRLSEALHALVAANGAFVSKTQLLRDIWNDAGDSRLVEVTISRLRKEIEIDPSHPELIITASGGYYYNMKRS